MCKITMHIQFLKVLRKKSKARSVVGKFCKGKPTVESWVFNYCDRDKNAHCLCVCSVCVKMYLEI